MDPIVAQCLAPACAGCLRGTTIGFKVHCKAEKAIDSPYRACLLRPCSNGSGLLGSIQEDDIYSAIPSDVDRSLCLHGRHESTAQCPSSARHASAGSTKPLQSPLLTKRMLRAHSTSNNPSGRRSLLRAVGWLMTLACTPQSPSRLPEHTRSRQQDLYITSIHGPILKLALGRLSQRRMPQALTCAKRSETNWAM